MDISNKKEPLILFLGDIALLIVSLWLALIIRYFEFPTQKLFVGHLIPFSILFAVWVFVFFVAGLYEKHTLLLKHKLPAIILKTQLTNSIIAIVFFYLIPYFTITPKTNLFIYILVSFVLILAWRMFILSSFGFKKKEKAVLIGSGKEMRELENEVNNNPRYNLRFVSAVDLDRVSETDFKEEILDIIYAEEIFTIVIDLKHEKVEPILPHLYNLIFSKVEFIDKYKVYEEIFDKVPLSLLGYNWFLENASSSPKIMYDLFKRFMDIWVSIILGVLSLAIYPFVYVAIKLDDGGPMFFKQDRLGRNNKIVRILKFRSMSLGEDPEVTKVGRFLRKSRLDEIPQLWNVLKGDLSLIGPRPEVPDLVRVYEKEIPYYDVRHLLKPGLSGWAQIYHDEHPHHSADVSETKNKLAYDLYYLKNRSIFLDLKIALRTLQILLSRKGS